MKISYFTFNLFCDILACRHGRFGKNCEQKCECYNGARCNKETGACKCVPGYLGPTCQLEHTGKILKFLLKTFLLSINFMASLPYFRS